MSFYSFIVSKIRNIRYSITGGFSSKIYSFGAIYSGPYKNYKHDPQPLIFCMWGSAPLVHGLNIHYLDSNDRAWLVRNIYMIKKYQQVIDPRTLYTYIKTNRYSIVKKCYRTYHQNLCDFKLVSAGITNLEKLEYTSNEPFVRQLNEAIDATKMAQTPTRVAFSTDELNNRIAESLNSVPLQKMSASQQSTGTFGQAQWLKR